MKLAKSACLTVCVALLPGAVGFAKDLPSFSVLSVSVNKMAHRTVPEFSLTERSGTRITLANLRGKIWIADFIYTSCTDTCPLQTADMARLQDRWPNANELQLVSFSVDPERDTPKVLSRYASRFKADPKRWLFLTGDRAAIAHLVEDGFHLPVARVSNHDHRPEVIVHSPQFVLVDRHGQIRGYYNDRNARSMAQLNADISKLLQE